MLHSANRLLVDNNRLRYADVLARGASADRKPLDRVLVEEGPRRDDSHERKSGSSKSNIDCKLDVLQDVADDKGDGLQSRGWVSKMKA